MSKKFFLLRVELKRIKPPIWRRICVAANINFEDLHQAIQLAMGWSGYHLYSFVIGNMELTDERHVFAEEDVKLSRKYHLNKLASKGSVFTYTYDFGDDWEHKITVMDDNYQIGTFDGDFALLAGKRACPPEDCGGEYGYYELLKALKDPKNPEYEEMLEWVADDWDPEKMDV
jgi:hypothetical protein